MDINSIIFLSFLNMLFSEKSCEEKYKDDKDACKKCIQDREDFFEKIKQNQRIKEIIEEFYVSYDDFIENQFNILKNKEIESELQTLDVEILKKYFEDMTVKSNFTKKVKEMSLEM